MNTKRKLNCYVFSNLIVSFITLNLFLNNSSTKLVSVTSNSVLNKIYEKKIEVINTKDEFINSETISNVIAVSNKAVKSENRVVENNNYVKPSYNSLTGNNLVNYARRFLGLRYIHAGNSLSTGTDCSGFTRLIYKEFGISLGRTVSSQLYSGTFVSKSDLQPGDIVFYSYGTNPSHVAIYMGDGLIIHESNPRDGVKISSVNIMNYITARRLITSNVVSNVASNEVVSEEVKVVEEKKEEVTEEVVQNTNEETPKETVVLDNKDLEVLEENKNLEVKEEPKEEVIDLKEESNKNNDTNISTNEVNKDLNDNPVEILENE